jgi:ADP-heptose:LPS heptosyltransferase
MKVEHRSTRDLADCRRLIDACGLDAQRLVLVHAGAQLPSRRWPIERFAQVARVLGADGWQIAITGSSGETELTAALAEALCAPAPTSAANRLPAAG